MAPKSDFTKFLERYVPCFWTPVEFLNYFGVFYTFAVVIALLIANANITCPRIMGGKENCSNYIWAGYFVIAQIIANFVCFHYFSKRNRMSALMPGKLAVDERQKHWAIFGKAPPDGNGDGPPSPEEMASFGGGGLTKFCVPCNESVPARSHHCSLCKYCVLKPDHHCFMVNGCVGFGNQRYFIVFVFWATVGAAYGTAFTFVYLNRFYKPFLPFGWINYLAPIAMRNLMFTFDPAAIVDASLCMLVSLGFASAVAAFLFFASQMWFVASGTSMNECLKRRRAKDGVMGHSMRNPFEPTSVGQRISAIFGPFWLGNFLVPMVWSENKLNRAYARALYDCYMKDV